jgi:hypothetical protein
MLIIRFEVHSLLQSNENPILSNCFLYQYFISFPSNHRQYLLMSYLLTLSSLNGVLFSRQSKLSYIGAIQNLMSFISCIHQKQYTLKDVPREGLPWWIRKHITMLWFSELFAAVNVWFFCSIFLPFASITFGLYFILFFLFYLWVCCWEAQVIPFFYFLF